MCSPQQVIEADPDYGGLSGLSPAPSLPSVFLKARGKARGGAEFGLPGF